MPPKRLLAPLASVALILGWSAAAQATVFMGSESFIQGLGSPGLTITAAGLPATFLTPDLKVGQSASLGGFYLQVSDTGVSGDGIHTAPVSITLQFDGTELFTFVESGVGTMRTLHSGGSLFGTNGAVKWAAPEVTRFAGDVPFLYFEDIIQFPDGSAAKIDISDNRFVSFSGALITGQTEGITITNLADPTNVPEPSTIAMFLSSLVMLAGASGVAKRR